MHAAHNEKDGCNAKPSAMKFNDMLISMPVNRLCQSVFGILDRVIRRTTNANYATYRALTAVKVTKSFEWLDARCKTDDQEYFILDFARNPVTASAAVSMAERAQQKGDSYKKTKESQVASIARLKIKMRDELCCDCSSPPRWPSRSRR